MFSCFNHTGWMSWISVIYPALLDFRMEVMSGRPLYIMRAAIYHRSSLEKIPFYKLHNILQSEERRQHYYISN